MWAALFKAILDWLTGLVKSQTGTAGEDVSAKPGLRDRLDRRLAEWKAGRGGKPADNGGPHGMPTDNGGPQ
jgi:hypothetical protein